LTSLAASAERAGDDDPKHGVRVSLTNNSDHLAFFVELRLVDATGADVLPILWSDNYVSLLPGDVMSLRATSPSDRALPPDVHLELRGVNVQPQQVPVVQDVAADRREGRQVDGVPDISPGSLPEMPLDDRDGPAATIGIDQTERMVTSIVDEALLRASWVRGRRG
ncbi:MAG TPA: glycoside hydrolase family 2 protein, partial [Kofleriaceae bacterium]